MKTDIYDIAGIGIGPFNLGLAALADPINELDCIFFDPKPSFSWHPGLMLDTAKLQVPFYADLVTGAEPASPFSFLSYMKQTGRLFQFAILEDNYISRKEYNSYCHWVASQLDSLYFGHNVVDVFYHELPGIYELQTETIGGISKKVFARHIVIGIGSIPFIPPVATQSDGAKMFHSSKYLPQRPQLLVDKRITIVGSGQSAAEIFYDVLQHCGPNLQKLDWVTKADRLFPMDTSKFSLELTSPDYIDYFHALSPEKRKLKLLRQDMLYKGINQELLTGIYRLLYHLDKEVEINIRTNCELKMVDHSALGCEMSFYHTEQKKDFAIISDALILATGYHRIHPTFLNRIKDRIRWEGENYLVARNYSIDKNEGEVFVQNADLHSHGFNAPDLGMGTFRNATILNAILGYGYFFVETKIAFQSFGVDD